MFVVFIGFCFFQWNSMERIRIQFDLGDDDIAKIIADSNPPNGIAVGKPTTIIKAAADSGGVFIQIAITFFNDVRDISIGILAAWLYDCCKQSGKKKGRVNNNEIIYSKNSIRRIVKQELKNQRARQSQRRNDKNRATKKRS
jgi:hypothetical protein